MTKLCDVNQAAKEKLLPQVNDKSGIGVHYLDAFLKPMNTTLADGTRVSCKRKGLKITLTAGTKKGEGLQEAAHAAGVELKITDAEIFIAG
ncbi:hypothetical protein HUU39_19790 [candidate division KSB1 bacterium]|nr:hypothetical protein [candidate division KSB1 bacterium]